MEKLIELLNEYEAKRHKTSIVAEIRKQKVDRLSYLEMNWNYSELLCISKGYGFIQWLVENDKIDFDKVQEKIGLERELYERMLYWYKETDFLIMLLSISDSPIEFLISIFK